MKNYMELLRRAKIFRGMEEKNILSMLDCLGRCEKKVHAGRIPVSRRRAGRHGGFGA